MRPSCCTCSVPFALLVAVTSGCTLVHSRPAATPSSVDGITQAQPTPDAAPAALAPPSTATLLDELPPDVRDAMAQYTASGKAPLIDQRKAGGFIRFPFGLSQPVVQFQLLREGPVDHRTVHVLIKPQDAIPMQTGLVIGTNRRVYRVKIQSGGAATVNVKFYYPADTVQRFNEQQTQRAAAEAPTVAKLPDVSIEDLHQNYAISGSAPFRPTWVADDGKRTYLKMPEGISATSAPALYVERPNGEKAIVNYTARLPYYVVQGLFDRALLQVGTGKDAQRVMILRQ